MWCDAKIERGGLGQAKVRFTARFVQTRDVEDVLARRYQPLVLDAAEATRQASPVAKILVEGMGTGFDAEASTQRLEVLARRYMLSSRSSQSRVQGSNGQA